MRRALLLLGLCACRKRAIPVDAAPLDPQQTIRADDAAQEILFVDLAGHVRTAAGVASVPAASRHVVAIEGPDGPGGAVWIADVSGAAPTWTATRGSPDELLRYGLAALPPGPASRQVFPPVDLAVDAPPPTDGIVVYGTAWCAPCADARDWLDARHAVYTFRDVERDGTAAVDAAARCASLNIAADRVPVIDLAGKLVIGFDPARLATILGEPI